MTRRIIPVLFLLAGGCADQVTEPTAVTTNPPPSDVTAPGVIEYPTLDGEASSAEPRLTFRGQANTCIPVAQLERDWIFTIGKDNARAVRLKVVQIYSPIASCDNIRPTTDGGIGHMTNLSPVSGDGSFPAGVGGVARYQLDSGLKCGAFEAEAWDLETGESLPHLHVYAPADCPKYEPPIVVPPPPQPPLIACPANPRDIWAKQPVRGQFGRFTDGRYVVDLAGYLKPEYSVLHIVLTSWRRDVPGQKLPQTLKGEISKDPSRSDMAVAAPSCSAQTDILVCPGKIPQMLDDSTFAEVDRRVAFADWNDDCPKPAPPSKPKK